MADDLDFTGLPTGTIADKLQGYSGNIEDRRLMGLLQLLLMLQSAQGKAPEQKVLDASPSQGGNLAKMLGIDDIPQAPPGQIFMGMKYY